MSLIELPLMFARVASRSHAGRSVFRLTSLHRLSTSATTPAMTVGELHAKLNRMMGTPPGYRQFPPDRSHLNERIPGSQDDLPVRTMKDSYDEVIIPLSSSGVLQERYTTVMGAVRMGRVLEDMDTFAVWLCQKHIFNPAAALEDGVTPYTIVTAQVDDISFEYFKPKVWNDMRLRGHVVWAGRTSLEARVCCESNVAGEWRHFTTAYFIMAARNSTNTKGAFVNRLVPQGPDEERLYEEAIARKKSRIEEENISLAKNPPTHEEQQLIFNKYMKTVNPSFSFSHLDTRKPPDNAVWMSTTVHSSEMHPHPQNRNHHNTFFGGTLMRLANELGWLSAFYHASSRPKLAHISKIEFRASVPIESFLKFTAMVAYVEKNFIQMVVICETTDLISKATVMSNKFHFTFEMQSGQVEVFPSTYMEALTHVQGIRYFNKFKRELQKRGLPSPAK
ncbi:Acyl-CoA thioesterase 9 [Nesidiocoris tenuis]|uniref:Acyl-CoA thioesterase 9 n=2 Tax=Nesidiocoris tenuis TaxID=355587 RepID=A0ABN7AIG2_9HEMI|nr:Acyl-CoA thioesterase 9 [Nesidiocoris tenuis]